MNNIPQIILDAQNIFLGDSALQLLGVSGRPLRPVITLDHGKVISTQWQYAEEPHPSSPWTDVRPEGVDCWVLTPDGARPINPLTVVETVAPNWISHIAFTPSQLLLDIKRFESFRRGGAVLTLRYGTDQSEYKRWFLRNIGIFPIGPVTWLEPQALFAWVKDNHPQLWVNPSVWAIAVQDGKVGLDIAASYNE
jgi:hypothetical protein